MKNIKYNAIYSTLLFYLLSSFLSVFLHKYDMLLKTGLDALKKNIVLSLSVENFQILYTMQICDAQFNFIATAEHNRITIV